MRPVRALIVSYAFPPVGGAGVQRVLKWVRYLPDHGVVPTVLTVRNPSAPVRDDSLLAEVAPPASVVRVPTLEPGYRAKALALDGASGEGDGRRSGAGGRAAGGLASELRKGSARLIGSALRAGGKLLFPDPQVLWLPAAIGAIYQFARRAKAKNERARALDPSALGGAPEKPFDVALLTAPPFSQFLLVPFIKAALGIPVVLDYRDEWTTTLQAGHDEAAHGWAARLAERLEKQLAVQADAITTATTEFADALVERITGLDQSRVHFLPNGYDSSDLPDPGSVAEPAKHDQGKFVLTYAGTVFRLTSLRGLIAGLRRLRAERPDLASSIELHVYGRVAPSEIDAFEGTEPLGVKLQGYVDHRAVLAALLRSHLNVCVLDDVPGAERIYPAKIFELMALGRRCLLLAPPGALARLGAAHGMGEAVGPRDERAIAATLAAAVEAWRKGTYEAKVSLPGVERYERRALAGELADLLRQIAGVESFPTIDRADVTAARAAAAVEIGSVVPSERSERSAPHRQRQTDGVSDAR